MSQSASSKSGSVLADHVAGTLAYLTVLPAILLLVMEPYQRNRTVRFHAWQCIDLTLAWCAGELVLWAAARVEPATAVWIEVIDSLFTLAFFVLWIMLIIKTVNGGRYRLPVIGTLAEKQAARVP